jgi:ATP-dependent Clp protease ATP-binding subunit ClpA
VLRLARSEADSAQCESIASGHILLAIVRDNASLATRILRELGADAEAIRAAVIRLPPADPLPVGGDETKVGIRMSPDLSGLLFSAAEHALDAGRRQIKIADLVLALVRDAATGAWLVGVRNRRAGDSGGAAPGG